MRAKFINEAHGFERGANPLKNLNIGIRSQIINWLYSMSIKNYIINDDLTIDVNGSVNLSYKNLTHFPKFIKFNHVSGFFWCDHNQLISLEGCPKIIDGPFMCSDSYLENLDYFPEYVGDDLFLMRNKLTQFTEEDIRNKCNVVGRVMI